MQSGNDSDLTFVADPGVVADRILTLYARTGREEAMKWLIVAARSDIEESARGVGYEPRPVLWYVIGKEISGDPTYYESEEFMNALQLGPNELPWYQSAVEAIRAYLSFVALRR